MLSQGLRNLAQSPALMRDLRQGVVSLKSSMTCSPSEPDWNIAYSQLASVFLESLMRERPTVTPRMTRPALPLGIGAWPLGETPYLAVRSPMNWMASSESRVSRRVFLTSLSQRSPPIGQM